MKLINMIKQKLEITNQQELIKKLGYNSVSKGLKTLDKFSCSEGLHLWLSSGNYDLVHTTTSFLERLCVELGIEPSLYEEELALAVSKNVALSKFKDCYIFINTNFKRTSEPIFALAFMESKRRISLDKNDIIFKDIDEVLNIVSTVVRDHYLSTKGKLALWGKIENYVYHHGDDKTYIFDTEGKIIEPNIPINESKAVLLINKKVLSTTRHKAVNHLL